VSQVSPQPRIRPAVETDLETVARIFAHYVLKTTATFEETPPSAESWLQRLAKARSRGLPFLVVDVEGKVVGYAYASPWRAQPAYRYTVEDSIYLNARWTGKTLGGLLLRSLLEECAAAGVRQVIAVIADTGDPASIRLHLRCGFAEAGRLRAVGYKHGRWIDTLLLQRALGAGSGP
jgi:L-amino acid N-acyltransferase YncA